MLAVGAGKPEVSLDRALANRGDVHGVPALRLHAHDVRASHVIMSGADHALSQHKGRCGDYALGMLHAIQRALPVRHLEVLAVGEDAKIRTSHENLFAEVSLKPGHDRHHDNERAHADHDATDRDHADERQQA
ncbi:MAG: hypothetical protein U0163_13265 [Gemmatimonadaceae bacterium]